MPIATAPGEINTPLNMEIGTADCNAGQTGGSVTHILVPHASNGGTAWYDVFSTFSFRS